MYAKANSRKRGMAAGVFFILAAVSAIAGVVLYDPILTGADYLAQGAAHADQVVMGAIMELVLVVSAVGTAVTMFPLLRQYNESMALGHVCFRFLEAVIITVGIVSVLSLLTVSQSFAASAAPDMAAFEISGTLLHAVHDWTFMLGPNVMLGINTMLYSYIFYKSGLVPRPLAILGMTGAALVLSAGVMEMFGVFEQVSTWGVVLALPVAAYEMTLAVWLIVKGFNANQNATR